MAVHITKNRGSSVVVDKELQEIEFENKCVECLETGRVYKDAKSACRDNGFSYTRMKKMLEGNLDFLRGHEHTKMHFAYTDKKVDKNGKVIEIPEFDEENE